MPFYVYQLMYSYDVFIFSVQGCRTAHYSDVIMITMPSRITSLTIVYLIVNSGTDPRKHQSSASLAFVRGIHRWPVNSPHKGQWRGKCFHLMTSSWIRTVAWLLQCHRTTPANYAYNLPIPNCSKTQQNNGSFKCSVTIQIQCCELSKNIK